MPKKKVVKKIVKELGNINLKYYAPYRTYSKAKYEVLKKALIKVIEKLTPEVDRKFDVYKIVVPGKGTKGLLRDEMGVKNFKDEDLYAYYNALQELVRKDKLLVCVASRWYARIR